MTLALGAAVSGVDLVLPVALVSIILVLLTEPAIPGFSGVLRCLWAVRYTARHFRIHFFPRVSIACQYKCQYIMPMKKRTDKVQFRLTAQELRALKLLAARAGLSLSAYLRESIRNDAKDKGIPI
ncbi:MAG: hypothetical protein AMJ84_00295 [Acidithiobacillales bacterium SM23_46]|nr:MAG: hypothetical protein AMJ84_00295 [Acidithiobacillales bacterium SM23_46]KPL29005.1 MAG: hypothetical protein AMJ72_00155 [Acidithiobacillales bacterium SM1_46]